MDLDNDYFLILGEIKSKVKTARLKAFRKVIHEEIMLYFEIGQILSKKQDELGWGSKVVEKLSLDLKKEFGEKSGYSERNLKYMLKLYKTYRYDEKVQQLAAQIPWTHNCIILDSCNNNSEREFYLRLVIEKGLSRNILKIQIEGNAEINSKSLVDNNFQNTIPENSDLAQSLLKDKYLFDFLGLNDKFNEKELENKILENIKTFLLELGGDFCFLGNQYKLKLGEDEYFIDLLFYHRELKCLFAIELKTIEFKPEMIGKMNFYLEILDDTLKKKNENS